MSELSITRAKAGKAGHRAVIDKYGPEFFRINGARGGRPPLKDPLDILFERPAAINNSGARQVISRKRRQADTPDSISHYNSLPHLKKLWRERMAGRGQFSCPRRG